MIPSWSYSKLSDFEKCRFLCYLKHDQKIPEPERPLPPGKTEHANDRGTRVHDAAERFVRGDGQMIHELSKFETPDAPYPEHFSKLRSLYAAKTVELEGEWGFDKDWAPADWRTAWLRVKLDVIVHNGKHSAIVIDHKTGKKFGNEIKHGEQLNLYVVAALMRYPDLEQVTAELWYLDIGDITSRTMTREQGLRFKPNFEMRGLALTNCNEWPANPNKYTCQWCLYGPEHSGHCSVGVRRA